MRVRGTDQNVVGGQIDLLRHPSFDRVADIGWKHARINDGDGDRLLTVADHQTAGIKRIVDSIPHSLDEATVSNRRQHARRNVDFRCAGTKRLSAKAKACRQQPAQ